MSCGGLRASAGADANGFSSMANNMAGMTNGNRVFDYLGAFNPWGHAHRHESPRSSHAQRRGPGGRTRGDHATGGIFRNNAGMSMVEVVIALGIIMVGLLALIAAVPLSSSLINQSSLKTTAAFLAQQRLERIKNAQWTTVPAVDNLCNAASLNGSSACDQWPDEDYGTIVFPGAQPCVANDHSGGCAYRRRVRIADCSRVVCSEIPTGTGSVSNVRQVTVTVFFRPISGVGTTSATEESLQLVTLIARRP